MISSFLSLMSRLIFLLSASLLLVACGGGVTGDSKNFIVVKDQSVINLNAITISEVHVDQTVCIVIYENLDAVMPLQGGVVLAKSTVLKGDYSDLELQLGKESLDGEVMFAELHQGACDDDSGVVITQVGGSPSLDFIVTRSTTPYIDVKVKDGDVQLLDEKLIVKKIVANKPTWVVVHHYDSETEVLGDVVGSVLVQAGHYDSYAHNKDIEIDRSVSISLQIARQGKGNGVEDGDELIVALYEDNVEFEAFDLSKDSLIEDAKSLKFNVKLEDGVVRFNIEAPNALVYEWTAINSAADAKIAPQANLGNEQIALTVGETYEIRNPWYGTHPFELMNGDVVLLSQLNQGVFMDDQDVNWSNVGGNMSFTLTQNLADQLTTYRCINHPIAMSGNFVIQ